MHPIGRALIIAALMLSPHLAHAHAQLRQAVPPAGGTVATAPAQIDLTFSAAVDPTSSTVVVTDATGARVDKADLRLVGGNDERLAVSLMALPPGTYSVIWHVTAAHKHKTEGSFTFTVGR